MSDAPPADDDREHELIDLYETTDGAYVAEGGGIQTRADTMKRALERLALLWPMD